MEGQEDSSQLSQIADTLVNLSLVKTTDVNENYANSASDTDSLLGNRLPSKGTVIFKGEVDVFLVKPDTTATQIKTSVKLRVVKFPTHKDVKSKFLMLPQAFIQVDDWIYPLAPNQMPVYKSSQGYYFPDLQSEVLGDDAVRICFVRSFPDYKKLVFEQILRDMVGISDIPDEMNNEVLSQEDVENSQEHCMSNGNENYEELSGKVRTGLCAAAELAKEGLSYGVDTTKHLIEKGTILVKKYTRPESESDQIRIGTDIKQTIETAKEYSGLIVQISSFIIKKLIAVTALLGGSAGSYLKSKAVQKLAQVTGQPSEEIITYYDSLSEVAGEAAEGMSVMCKEINEAAKTIGSSLTENSLDIIDHCYGPDVAEIVGNTTETIANVTSVGLHMVSMEPEKLISRTVKETYGAVMSKPH